MRRLVREPLLHFLVGGVVLFSANRIIHGPDRAPLGDSVVISQGRVQQIAESYRLLAGHLPSRVELQGLVDDFVTEEIDYREAVSMGLDADDTIVRRRMRQKLEFLIEDPAASEEPSNADLLAWLATHAADYRLPERRAIRQVLASRDTRGAGVEADAAAMLTKVQGGADPAALFGDPFAHAVFAHEGAGWFGPIASPFGRHLVQVIDVEAGRAPSIEDVRDRLRSDWIEDHRDAARDAFQRRMRQRYQVRIEWPDVYKGLPSTPNPTPKTGRSPLTGATEE